MSTDFDISEVQYMTDAHRQRTIAGLAIGYVFATIAVALRFMSRRIARNPFWWDDWLAAAGLLVTGAFCACVVVCLPTDDMLHGSRRMSTALFIRNAKAAWVSGLFYYANQLLLKLSILCFYWRLFSLSNYMRRSIQVIWCLVVMWFIASFLVAVLQCVPIEAAWDPAANMKPGAKCVNSHKFFLGSSLPNIVGDLVLVLLPVPPVLQLKITTTQKVFIIFFFLLGGFVVIASVVRLHLLVRAEFTAFPVNWTVDDVVVWTISENCCGVISICLASLRPIIKLLPWESIQQALGRSSGRSKGSKNGNCPTTGLFRRSRPLSEWNEIDSSNERPPDAVAMKADDPVNAVAIEMQPEENASEDELARSFSRYGYVQD